MEKNQRRHKRVPIAASARISYTGNEGSKTIDSTVASISLPGIGLYADCMPAKGTAVTVEISFITTDGLLKTDVIEGKVVNANEVGELCYICVVFEESINENKQPYLHTHLRKIILREET
jgi:hypothetical protein